MCQRVYLASPTPLPLVAWEAITPTFYVVEASLADQQMLRNVLEGEYFYYAAGSFMGCSCGLFCDSSLEKSEPETYPQRLADSVAFKRYLLTVRRQHALWLFTTDWRAFPDVYPRANLSLSAFGAISFDLAQLPEDEILTITA